MTKNDTSDIATPVLDELAEHMALLLAHAPGGATAREMANLLAVNHSTVGTVLRGQFERHRMFVEDGTRMVWTPGGRVQAKVYKLAAS